MKKTALILTLSLIVLGSSFLSSEAHMTSQPRQTNDVILMVWNDGWGYPFDQKVEVPVYLSGSGETPTIAISFSIHEYGTGLYYGDDPGENWKNITITGDILDSLNGLNIVHLTYGDWQATVTPTQALGTFTLAIHWPSHGNASVNFQILNGTSTTPSTSTFLFDKDTNVTATVTDADGMPMKYASVYAFRPNDHTEFAAKVGTNIVGNGKDGQYRFSLNTTNQGNHPQDIVIAARGDNDHYWSLAKIQPTTAQPSLMFIKGRFTNLTIDNGNLTFKAVNIVTHALPFLNTTHYTHQELIVVHHVIAGFLTQRFILGICKVAVIA
jgi:hypothetical protein